jgi:hypothetical protein
LQSSVSLVGSKSPALSGPDFPNLPGPQPPDLDDPQPLPHERPPDLVSGAQTLPASKSLISLAQVYSPVPPWKPSYSAVEGESPTSELQKTAVAEMPNFVKAVGELPPPAVASLQHCTQRSRLGPSCPAPAESEDPPAYQWHSMGWHRTVLASPCTFFTGRPLRPLCTPEPVPYWPAWPSKVISCPSSSARCTLGLDPALSGPFAVLPLCPAG